MDLYFTIAVIKESKVEFSIYLLGKLQNNQKCKQYFFNIDKMRLLEKISH